MKIILLKDHDQLGKAGEMVEAKDGYARNFLIPRKVAIEATPENQANWEIEQQKRKEEEAIAIEEANKLKEQIESLTINIEAKGGQGGRLFGSITNNEISKALKEQADINIAKNKIELDENIKTAGVKEVTIRVYPEITANLKVNVEAK
ncbi:MAG: 50S ribosomal protein L9 [Tissierellia bacterium]|jgi:large subunit ribosomal protein L9|nr:50S ribosomal protein L9 [Tissierellia bacterium]